MIWGYPYFRKPPHQQKDSLGDWNTVSWFPALVPFKSVVTVVRNMFPKIQLLEFSEDQETYPACNCRVLMLIQLATDLKVVFGLSN